MSVPCVCVCKRARVRVHSCAEYLLFLTLGSPSVSRLTFLSQSTGTTRETAVYSFLLSTLPSVQYLLGLAQCQSLLEQE